MTLMLAARRGKLRIYTLHDPLRHYESWGGGLLTSQVTTYCPLDLLVKIPPTGNHETFQISTQQHHYYQKLNIIPK